MPFDKLKVPSTAEGLRVDPERRFFTPPSNAGVGGTEWVNLAEQEKLEKVEKELQDRFLFFFEPFLFIDGP